MKNCKFAGTTKCPFDDSDQGPPFAGSVKSCDLFNPRFFCMYFEDMKNADAIYARNVAAMNSRRAYGSAEAARYSFASGVESVCDKVRGLFH